MQTFFLRTAAASFLTVGLVASLSGQSQKLEKVATPPPLIPLPMAIGGRTFITPPAHGEVGPVDYASQWPGAYFQTAFRGTELYFRVGTAHEILHLVLDGQPPVVLNDPAPGIYRVSGMRKGKHEVTLLVATEAQAAPNSFGGFSIPAGESGLAVPKRNHQMEFVGDSHTVGYGDTSKKTDCTEDEVWATTDSTQAFGALTASHYHADYQINAISGHGVVRNYDGSTGDPVPDAYPYVLFDKQHRYSDPDWKPRVIVIALGTNDFSTPLHAGEKWKTRDDLHADYEATYVRFIQHLRAIHPDAYIILWATEMANGEIESEVKKVIGLAKAQGEKRIGFIPIDHLAFSGCHSHPSLADHKTISEKLISFIDAHPAIWRPTN